MGTKKMFIHTRLFLLTLFFLSGCSLNNTPTPPAYERLQGRWNYNGGTIIKYNYSKTQVLASINLPVMAGDYLEFRTDNKFYSRLNGIPDTLGYGLIGESHLITHKGSVHDTVNIVYLTSNNFSVLNRKFDIINVPATVTESTFNFSR